jgi:hypothetical protein
VTRPFKGTTTWKDSKKMEEKAGNPKGQEKKEQESGNRIRRLESRFPV